MSGPGCERHGRRFTSVAQDYLNMVSRGMGGGRNERHPVNGANVEPSEQMKCASWSADRRGKRGAFYIANCQSSNQARSTPFKRSAILNLKSTSIPAPFELPIPQRADCHGCRATPLTARRAGEMKMFYYSHLLCL